MGKKAQTIDTRAGWKGGGIGWEKSGNSGGITGV